MSKFFEEHPLITKDYSKMFDYDQRHCLLMYCFWLELYQSSSMTEDDVTKLREEIVKLRSVMAAKDVRRTEKQLGYTIDDVLTD